MDIGQTNKLGDSVVPIYELTWDDGTSRRTDERVAQLPIAIENFVQVGRDDPECEVELVGYSNQ